MFGWCSPHLFPLSHTRQEVVYHCWSQHRDHWQNHPVHRVHTWPIHRRPRGRRRWQRVRLSTLPANTPILTHNDRFIASTIPAWQAECLKTQRRGTLLLVSFGGCIALGLTLSYWLSFGFSWVHTSSVAWRFPIAFSILIILPALIMIAFLPESPRYLLLCGKEKEALNVLSALEELPADHEDVRREVLLIKNTVLRLAGGSSFTEIFSMGKERHLHRVILAGRSYATPHICLSCELTTTQLCCNSSSNSLESTSSFNSWDLCSANSSDIRTKLLYSWQLAAPLGSSLHLSSPLWASITTLADAF